MALTIKISSTLRSYVDGYDPLTGLFLDPVPGETVADVLNRLGIPLEKVKLSMVNGLTAPLDRPVTDGDRLGLFPPVGGG